MTRGTPLTTRSPVRGFRWAILVIMTVVTISVVTWLGARIEDLVQSEALAQSRSYTDLIIAARAWNSEAGGVYLPKTETVRTNPYLILLGVEPDVELTDGTQLTMRNPAAMTTEIGDQLPIAENGSDFKLTSLEAVNPANDPDDWERAGLEEFDDTAEDGTEEYWAATEHENERVFRYMRPLLVDSSCLTCHGASGYRVGDVRGAISVRLPYEETTQALQRNRIELVAVAGAILVLLWLAVWMASRWLESKLAEANRQLEHAANTDALTGLWNRGFALRRLDEELERSRRHEQAVGVVLVDIDHFKEVNDTFGHAAGDTALRNVARILRDAVRTYDIVGRIGGEELLIIAPDIEPPGLADLAERIRAAIAASKTEAAGDKPVTVSAGTAYTSRGGDSDSSDTLIARADTAMYAAKEAGRDRVVEG